MVEKPKRMELRLDRDTYDRFAHYAAKSDMSLNEWLQRAGMHYADWMDSDYDLPTAEIQRLNQLIEVVTNLVASQKELTQISISGINATLGLARGGSYLTSESDDAGAAGTVEIPDVKL